ncbi:hypothetical protein D3C81_2195480 [compost metagenome]
MAIMANKELTFTLDPTTLGTIKLLSIRCIIISAPITMSTWVNEVLAKVSNAIINIEVKIPI